MVNHEEDALKKWRPGTKEVDSYFVKYMIEEERFGMYVTATDTRDAINQVSRLIPNALSIQAKQQEVTKEHERQIEEFK